MMFMPIEGTLPGAILAVFLPKGEVTLARRAIDGANVWSAFGPFLLGRVPFRGRARRRQAVDVAGADPACGDDLASILVDSCQWTSSTCDRVSTVSPDSSLEFSLDATAE